MTNQPDTGDIRYKLRTIVDDIEDYYLSDRWKEPMKVNDMMFVDQILVLFADKLAGLLEEKESVEYPHDNYGDYEGYVVPVSAVERLIKEVQEWVLSAIGSAKHAKNIIMVCVRKIPFYY